jgi:SAM-dependent methyltransferase
MANELVRQYINTRVSGDPHLWPMDWFARTLGGRRLEHALSIGCGAGALERDLVQRDLCDHVDAFDGSQVSLDVARAEADRLGMSDRISYYVGDFNEPRFPRPKYDVVFFHQSAHHVAKLEKIYRAILSALTPDGILYLDEYVGPCRFEWDAALLGNVRSIYELLPSGVKAYESVPPPIQIDDPSEAFRSSEIIPLLRVGFTISEQRDYGGNLLAILFPLLTHHPDDVVTAVIKAEEQLLAAGTPSYYTTIIARPKRGARRAAALLRYYIEPKAQRVRRELARRLTRSESSPR